MSSSEFETQDTRPVEARCDGKFLHVALADGRETSTPLRWYPFLEIASPDDRAEIELLFEGVWWPAVDEGVSVKMLPGWKVRGAVSPSLAAE